MKKIQIVWMTVICLVLTISLMACSQSKEESKDESKSSSEQTIDYRLVDKKEGSSLLLGNEAYYDGLTQNDLDYRMQKTGANLKEYQDYAKDQVLDFSDEQKALVDEQMDRIQKTIRQKGYKLPELDQISFVCTTMKEECEAGGYTHGTQIYISADILDEISSGDIDEKTAEYFFAHELFHCLTRCNPDFRAEMYKLVHFTIQDKEYKLPPSVLKYFITNPDVEHHDSYATFKIDGKDVDCYTAFVTTRHFRKKGDSFFELGTTALVPVDGADKFYTKDQASNFDEVFGTNTEYVIDPEECLADNFGLLFSYGEEGPEGKGYPNPEIIKGMEDILTN